MHNLVDNKLTNSEAGEKEKEDGKKEKAEKEKDKKVGGADKKDESMTDAASKAKKSGKDAS